MKILLDTCVCGGVLQQLEAEGYDVIWSGNWDEDAGTEFNLELAEKLRQQHLKRIGKNL